MDTTGIAMLIGMMMLPAALIALWWWFGQGEITKARRWPQMEATIESGELEGFSNSEYGEVELSVFAFSYKVEGEYYSGRFALLPYITDPGPSILTRMVGRRLRVHSNPRRPEEWYVPDELIEGCKVQQRIGPHLNSYYPR